MISRRILVGVLSALVLVHIPAYAQMPQKMQEPTVHFGLYEKQPNGLPRGSASQNGDGPGADLSGTVYITPCEGVGGANPGHEDKISASATEMWRLSGSVVALSADQASAQLSWQRTRQLGQDVDSGVQTRSLVLKRGERVTLETIDIPAAGACLARTVALDVIFESHARLLESVTEAMRARQSANATGSGQTGSGQMRMFEERVGDARVMRMAPPGAPAPRVHFADLWLVRSAPGRADETTHITSSVLSFPAAFAFPPFSFQSAEGTATIQVNGTVESGLSPDGRPTLFFSAGRRVAFSPSAQPTRDNAPTTEASTKTSVPMPGPDDVIAFELPPLRLPGGGTLPEQLSIRIRVTSRPMAAKP